MRLKIFNHKKFEHGIISLLVTFNDITTSIISKLQVKMYWCTCPWSPIISSMNISVFNYKITLMKLNLIIISSLLM